ncbi:restriction endonuclease subunit S [Aequorivita capsosiphonis]|uniref:restriction endonuclease subunit S n=1 Tax=Aequorivita capsosiphonis TaxID=487317 RepID=UPI0003F55AB6|nr:restriction endonuclease subunit S [Aequorivita capsosiphonis]
MKTRQLTPQVRFPEFEGEWSFKLLGEVCKIQTGSKDTQDKVDDGLYPFYVRSNTIEKINSYSFDKPAILTSGDGAGVGKIYHLVNGKFDVHQRVYALTDFKNDFSIEFTYQFFSEKFYKRVMRLSAKNSVDSVRRDMIFDMKMYHPTYIEQQKIATFLTSIDSRLQNLEKKKSLLEDYKRGVMQQIFKQEIRFKNENGKEFPKWEKRRFSDVLFEHKLKSTGNEEVHSVSVHKGVINQIEHLGRSFSAKNTDHYSRALPNDIIYTKSPTGDFPLGIIKQNHIQKDVIISPLYGVFTPETKGLGYMLHVYFESPINTSNYLSSIIQKGAKNTINITNNTFLSKRLLLPVSKEEQTKIANFLSAIDKKIELVNEQIEKTKTYKKGLLQQMFV